MGVIYISVALISMSVLILEISFTRIFSLLFEYHYAFLLISLAILGLGAGGIYVHRRILKGRSESNGNVLFASAALFSLSVLAITISIAKFPAIHNILLLAALTFFPFFFAGIFLSAVFRLFTRNSPQIYAADLIGASLGAVFIIPFLKLGAISANLFVSLVAGLPVTLLWIRKSHGSLSRGMIPAFVIGLLAAFLGNAYLDFLGEIPVGRGVHKEMFHFLSNPAGKAKVIDSRWSAFGRTDMVADETTPDEVALFIDGTAGTTMYRFDGKLESLREGDLPRFPGYFPFALLPEKEKEKALVIGAGGGREVLVALLGGAKEITAVEVNKDLVDLVKKYSRFNGGIYNELKGVKVVVEEGRNFVRRMKEEYDLVMLTVPVTKTSRSLEGFALTENFLFTVESIGDYLDRLKPTGRLVIVAHDDLEIFRLVFNALAALKRRGIDTAAAMKHIYTLGPEAFPVFVLKKSSLTPEEAEGVHRNMHKYQYASVSSFIPFIPQATHKLSLGGAVYHEHEMFNQALYLLAKGEIPPEVLIAAVNYEIGPVTDDSPFFYKFEVGLPSVVALLLALSAIAMILAWVIKPKEKKEGNNFGGNLFFLSLFSSLGMGFMLIEIPLIQKFILFLGQPIYAMAVLLFSLLIGAGIGSRVGGSIWPEKTRMKLGIAALMVGLLTGLSLLWLSPVFNNFLGASFLSRVLISFALLSPLGFFMGIPFPLGMRLLEEMGLGAAVPQMWGVNGIGSVLGSALAVALATGFGFSYALISGSALYFLVFAMLFFSSSTRPRKALA